MLCTDPLLIRYIKNYIFFLLNRYTATDAAGNINKCSFVVTVLDDEIPQITCPADVTVTVDHNSNGGTAYWTNPVLGDNSDSIVTVSCDHNSGDSSFMIGQTMVVCRAHDGAGNEDVCSFIVTVVDNEPPVLTCPPPVVVYTELNLNTAVASWKLPVVTDNSGNFFFLSALLEFTLSNLS